MANPPLNTGGTSSCICKIPSTSSIVTDMPESNMIEYLDEFLFFKIITPTKSITNCSSNSIRFPFANTSISLRPLMCSWKGKSVVIKRIFKLIKNLQELVGIRHSKVKFIVTAGNTHDDFDSADPSSMHDTCHELTQLMTLLSMSSRSSVFGRSLVRFLFGDSDFFFVPRSCLVDQYTLHISLLSLKFTTFVHLPRWNKIIKTSCNDVLFHLAASH